VEGFIAVTDHGWYQHLSRTLGPKDANFWRPSTRPVRLGPGTPFLFKLKAPHNAIAGFGFFATFSVLPDWLAWDTFDEANGVGSLGELRDRLRKIQVGARIEPDPLGQIGCSLIAEARFFEPSAWIPAPADWKSRMVTGETYDLEIGEGRRIWRECLMRVGGTFEDRGEDPEPPAGVARFGAPTLYQPRLGQGIFRVQVLDAYGRACAVTQEHSLPVLEAAHIRPFSQGGAHDVRNGLALRSDVHRLFDRGYVTIDEEHRFVVGRRLKDDFANGRSYYGLHRLALVTPTGAARPASPALAWYREQVFLG
jgi:putative restriction endonuclease